MSPSASTQDRQSVGSDPNSSAAPGSDMKGLPLSVKLILGHLKKARFGTLKLTLPDGRAFAFQGAAPGPQADATIHDWNLIKRCLRSSDIGVGEGYIAGEWSSTDVTAFLEYFVANAEIIEQSLAGHPIIKLWLNFRHWLNRNTKSGSKRNISAHYDLGNAFYSRWLDRSMTYSSALFQTGANDLQTAQMAKYRALAESTDIQPGHHVLEIGCGFGGFAEFVAREIGARVTGLTISQQQFDYATSRIEKAGLSDRVDIVMRDYRDEKGLYDRIASIEMFEAVGEKYWPTFFAKVDACLKQGGRAGVQTITIQDAFFAAYRKTPDFIQRHIFPGGMLPPPHLLKEIGSRFGLDLVGERIFGQDYARTLAEWRDRFQTAWPEITPMGFDERFKRLWEFYLHYCEAGFRQEYIDVRQVVYAKA